MSLFTIQLEKDRLKSGLTKKDIADKAGYTKGYIGQIFKGKDKNREYIPNDNLLRKLAKILNADYNKYKELITLDKLKKENPDFMRKLQDMFVPFDSQSITKQETKTSTGVFFTEFESKPVSAYSKNFSSELVFDNPENSPLNAKKLFCKKNKNICEGWLCLVEINGKMKVLPYNKELMDNLSVYKIIDAK